MEGSLRHKAVTKSETILHLHLLRKIEQSKLYLLDQMINNGPDVLITCHCYKGVVM